MQTNLPVSRVLTWSARNASTLRVAGVALALACAACAQRLGPLTPMDRTHFQVGVTRKTEVANTLGLPTSRHLDQGYEYWDYSDGPALSSVDIPIVTGTSTTPVATLEHVEVAQQEATVLVYVFRSDGVLSSVRDLRGAR